MEVGQPQRLLAAFAGVPPWLQGPAPNIGIRCCAAHAVLAGCGEWQHIWLPSLQGGRGQWGIEWGALGCKFADLPAVPGYVGVEAPALLAWEPKVSLELADFFRHDFSLFGADPEDHNDEETRRVFSQYYKSVSTLQHAYDELEPQGMASHHVQAHGTTASSPTCHSH